MIGKAEVQHEATGVCIGGWCLVGLVITVGSNTSVAGAGQSAATLGLPRVESGDIVLDGLGIALATDFPGGQVLLNHVPVRLTAEAVLQFDRSPTDVEFLSVESGEITISANTDLIASRRERGAVLSPVNIAAGTEFLLSSFASVILPAAVDVTIENRGPEPVVLIVTNIRPNTHPATPVATP